MLLEGVSYVPDLHKRIMASLLVGLFVILMTSSSISLFGQLEDQESPRIEGQIIFVCDDGLDPNGHPDEDICIGNADGTDELLVVTQSFEHRSTLFHSDPEWAPISH